MIERPLRLSAQAAIELARRRALTLEQLMVELAQAARAHSVAPVSGYRVGAVGRGLSGALYVGFNLEFPQNSAMFVVHAEQFVVAHAMSRGESGLTALAVTTTPCGHCRQFLTELPADIPIYLPEQQFELRSLLPHSFDPSALSEEAGLMRSGTRRVRLRQDSSDLLVLAAVEAAERAYCPYSGNAAGVALGVEDLIYSGSAVENAAYNPGMGPLQAALVSLLAERPSLEGIQRVVLAEQHQARHLCHEPVTLALLRTVAPGAAFETHPVCCSS